MTLEQDTDVKKGVEFDWEKYPPYQWFMKEVGGPGRLIPKQDGLSWILRIHHREYTEAMGINPRMSRNTASLIKSVDDFYQFKKSNVRRYGYGSSPTKDANPAGMLFKTTSIADDPEGNFAEISKGLNINTQLSQVEAKLDKIGTSGIKRFSAMQAAKYLFTESNRKAINSLIALEIKKKFLGK